LFSHILKDIKNIRNSWQETKKEKLSDKKEVGDSFYINPYKTEIMLHEKQDAVLVLILNIK
jgi:hypothetical protein